MSKVTHVKIREPLGKLVAELSGKNPSVIVGAAFCNTPDLFLKLLQAQGIS